MRRVLILFALLIFVVSGGYSQDFKKTNFDPSQKLDKSLYPKPVWKSLPYNPSQSKAVIIEEGFESGAIPEDWTQYKLGDASDPGFIVYDDPSTYSLNIAPHSGTYAIAHNDDDLPTAAETWLVIPVQLDASSKHYTLSFWEAMKYFNAYYYNYHGVWISTGSGDPNDGEFEEIYETQSEGDPWQQIELDLFTYLENASADSFYIAFKYIGDYADEWYIDDIKITKVEQYDLAVTSITNFVVNGATITPEVTVSNVGLNDATNFTVTLTQGTEYTSTKTIDTLATGVDTVIEMDSLTPSFQDTTVTMVATVTFASDGDLTNNELSQDVVISEWRSENFDNPPIYGWAVEDYSGGESWLLASSTEYSHSAPNFLYLKWNSTSPQDDWIITCGSNLEAGKTYYIEFWLEMPGYEGTADRLALYVGTEQSSDSLTEQIWDSDGLFYDEWTKIAVTYTPSSDGIYYFGWHAYTPVADVNAIFIDDAKIEQAYRVTFTVTDLDENAIEDATIAINDQTLTTDASGQATIDLLPGTYAYTVSASGYADYDGSLEVVDQDIDVPISLTPVYTVTFTVVDGVTEDPVEGAEIAINDETLTTDANGQATIDLEPGIYPYVVSKTDYSNYVDTLELASNTSLTVELMPAGANLTGLSSDIVISPNPVVDVLRIVIEKFYRLEVLSLSGRLLGSYQLNSKENYIDMSTLPSGVYVLRLIDENGGVSSYRLIKE